MTNPLTNPDNHQVLQRLIQLQTLAHGSVPLTLILNSLDGWQPQRLRDRLSELSKAGLVRRMTDFQPQDDPNETAAFRARYHTTERLGDALKEFAQRRIVTPG